MSFVPAQFSSFTSKLDFNQLKSDTTSGFTTRLANLRPPQDFFDVRRLSKPTGPLDLQQRVSYNLGYFSSNYIAICALISLYLIITNMPLLFLIVFDVSVFYLVQKFFGNADELNLPFFTLQKNVIYAIVVLINIPVLLFSSPISTLMWLVLSSAAVVFSHAALMDKPVEAHYSAAV